MKVVKELWEFMRRRKKLWLLPPIVILLMFSVLIALVGGSAIAPFIYSLF